MSISRNKAGLMGLAALAALGGVLIVLVGSPAHARSGRVHVSAAACNRAASVSGSDSQPGTVARPFRTIEKLAERLRPGQVGCLLGGTFEQDVFLRHGGATGRPITLMSAPGRRATIVGSFDVGPDANNVVIKNLRLEGRGGASPQVNGDRVTFRGNEITNDHTGICVLLGAGFEDGYGVARDIVIDHNHIHDCGRLPAAGHDHGIYVEGTENVRITNNVIYDNADYAVQLYPNAQRTYVARNIMDGNGGGVIFAGEKAGGEYRNAYASSNNVVRNNVISNSREYHNVESSWGGPVGTGNVATRNCVWNGADGNISDPVGFLASKNVVARPAFRNRAAGDFRLMHRSVCRRIRWGR